MHCCDLAQGTCIVDVIIALVPADATTNVASMKTIASDFVAKLDIDSGNTRVGCLLVGETQTTVFFLNAYTTTAAVQSTISSLTFSGPPPNGLTKMEAALSLTRGVMLTAGNGDRSDAPNVVVAITDGPSAYPTTTQVSILYELRLRSLLDYWFVSPETGVHSLQFCRCLLMPFRLIPIRQVLGLELGSGLG